MTKKLYVPNRMLAQKAKAVNPTPKAISKSFDNKEEANIGKAEFLAPDA